MALGSADLARISYYDGSNGDLRYIQCTNTSCNTKTNNAVDTTGTVGSFNSVTLGLDGFARIGYSDDTNGDLKYAQCTNNDCSAKVITALDTTGVVGQYPSIAIGSDGYSRIAYYDATNLDLKLWVESTYTGTVARTIAVGSGGSGPGQHSSSAIGSDGYSRLAYWAGQFAGNNLIFAQCNDGTCSSSTKTTADSTAGSAAGAVALAMDLVGGTGGVGTGTGFGRIAYTGSGGSLMFAQCTTANCASASTVKTTIDASGNSSNGTSLVMDNITGTGAGNGTGWARIVYMGSTGLKYMQCSNAACTGSTPVIFDAGTSAYYPSIANDPITGYARISYYAYSGGNFVLKFIKCTSASCASGAVISTVANVGTGYTGTTLSLAMGSDGFGRIVYGDNNNFDLRYVRCGDADCDATGRVDTIVDSMGTVGYYASLALGSDGFGRISYFDSTNGYLKYAKCTNVTCSTKNILTADSTVGTTMVGQPPGQTSINVGSDGWARVAYFGGTNLDLRMWFEDSTAGTPVIASFYYAVAPASGIAGAASTVFTVGAKDISGNVINAPSNTSVYLYSSGSGGTFSTTSGGAYTSALTITIPSGSPSADYYYKNSNLASYTLTASDNSSAPDGGTGIIDATAAYSVAVGTASQYTLTPSTQTITANNPGTVITLTTKDSSGNVSNVVGNKTFTLSDASSGQFSVLSSPFTPVSTVTVNGGASSTTFYYKASVPGTYTITATLAGFTATSGGNAVMTVNQATITQYYYTTAPASGAAGSASTVFTVGAKDSNGNVVVVSANRSVYLYSSGTGGTFSTTSGGIYTSALTVTITTGSTTTNFFYKNNSTSGSPYTLTASDNSSAPDGATGIVDATTSYTVNPGSASVAVLTPSTQTITANLPSSVITLTTKDGLGNTVAVGSNTTFALSSTGTGGQFSVLASPFTPVSNVTVNSGTSSTSFFYRNNTAGSYTITAHAASGFSDGTAGITVSPAAIASYYYATAPATGAAGVSSTVFTVGAHDAFGNVVTVGSNQVVYLYSSAPSGTFSNTTNAGPFTATSTTITTGNTTANFYYKNNSTSGSPYTLTASDNSSAPDGATGIVDATTSYSVTAGTATVAVLSPSTQSVTAGAATSAITLTTKDSLGNTVAVGSNTTFTLSDGGNGGVFSTSGSGGPFTATNVVVTSGSSTATFFYKNNTTGSYTLTAHNAGFTDGTTSVLVSSAAIASYYFSTTSSSTNINVASGVFTVGAHDVFGNVVTVASNTTVYLYSSSTNGTFSNSGSGGPFTATTVTILSGNTSASFYYKDPIAANVTITASDQTPTHTPDTGIADASTAFTVFNPDVVVGPNMPLPVRSATLDDSRPGDPNVHFSWNSSTASLIKGIRIQVCTDGLANTACTTPTGSDLTPATLTSTGGQLGASAWAITTVVSAHEILITNATGASTTIGGTSTLDLGNFVNPTSIGTFFFRISTYTTTAALPGDSVSYGAIGTSTNRSLTVTGDVAESLVFRVANAISVCDGASETNIADPNDAASDLVTLSPNPMTTSGASIGTAQFCASTNAQHGYAITYADWGSNSYDGHKGFWNGSHQFNPGGISAFTSTPGTEQFGFKVGVAGSGSGTVTAPYNAATYNYNDSGSAVQLASASVSTIANIYTVSYLANVSATTPGGTYRAHQMFVITATF
jgi:hypothetical protein